MSAYQEALKRRLDGKDPLKQKQQSQSRKPVAPGSALKSVANDQLEQLRAQDYNRYRTGQ